MKSKKSKKSRFPCAAGAASRRNPSFPLRENLTDGVPPSCGVGGTARCLFLAVRFSYPTHHP